MPSRGILVTAALLALGRIPEVAAQGLPLDRAIESALAAHPTLAVADARVDAASESRAAARAARLPGASLDATLTRFQEPMIVAPFHSLDFTSPPTFDRTLVQGRLGVAYTVFDGGGRSSRIRAADATFAASEQGRASSAMDVLEETVDAYLGVVTARAVSEAATARRAALEEEMDRARQRFDAGAAARVELLRAAASLQDALADEGSANAAVGLAERSLGRTTGLPSEDVAGAALDMLRVASAEIVDERQATNPLVLGAERTAEAAEARVDEQRSGRLPTLQAGAGVLDFGTLDDEHVLEWQAGLQLSWPLFTGGARSASTRRAQAEASAARSALEETRLRVAEAVDAAATASVEADARLEALTLAVDQWEEVARIEALALEAGSGVQSDLLEAQAGLFGARAGLARARRDAVLARVRLAHAQGTLDRDWIDESLEVIP